MSQQYDPAYGAPEAPRQQSKQSNGFAVTSLVLGIVAFIPYLGFVTGPLAIIFGALRLRRGSTGRGMAIAGFVLGIVTSVLWLIVILVAAIAASSGSHS